ncbi:alpha/beta hydrolase [Paenibacillus gansuensis]|uniref:Alpha/beta hydrolase n=1 Tax=Paenibacillus gansuensis TaxID=306542 RepID=A0ABW5PFE6_9BACL
MTVLLTVLAVLLLAALLLLAAFWGLSAKAQTPKRRPIERVPDMPYEDITFPSHGSTLKGWFVPSRTSTPDGAKQPVIIIAHGWNSNRSRVLRYARPLYDAGYALLLYDARSHGESDGIPAPSGMAFRDDLVSAVDYLTRRPDIDPERIGALGHSLGGFGTVAALWDEHRLRAVVTDSMPVRIETMIYSELSRLRLPKFPLAYIIPKIWLRRSRIDRNKAAEFDLIGAIKRRQGSVPVLHVHSRNDDYIPSAELDYLASHRLAGAEHLYVQAPGHSSSETDPQFWNRVLRFFNEHLCPVT